MVGVPARDQVFAGDVDSRRRAAHRRGAASHDLRTRAYAGDNADRGRQPPARRRAARGARSTRSSASTGPWSFCNVGSALKLCLLAEGEADVYPRLAPTSEWDTAAAQAVLEAAGGAVLQLGGAPLAYNKPDILNPEFVAVGGSDLRLAARVQRTPGADVDRPERHRLHLPSGSWAANLRVHRLVGASATSAMAKSLSLMICTMLALRIARPSSL